MQNDISSDVLHREYFILALFWMRQGFGMEMI
jgi:hypothetical protein